MVYLEAKLGIYTSNEEILIDEMKLTDKVRTVKLFCEAFNRNFENLENSITCRFSFSFLHIRSKASDYPKRKPFFHFSDLLGGT